MGTFVSSPVVNLANALTIGRLLLVPAVVALLATQPESVVVALAVVAVAATDCLDGYFARSRDEVTKFGTALDPLVDKVLIIAAMFTLAAVDRLELWAAVIVLGRELAVSALRLTAARDGEVIPAGGLGKAKMWMQVATVAAVAAVADPTVAWVQALVYSTVAITVLSGVDYFTGQRRAQRRTHPRAA